MELEPKLERANAVHHLRADLMAVTTAENYYVCPAGQENVNAHGNHMRANRAYKLVARDEGFLT